MAVSVNDKVESISRRRARMTSVLAIVFIATQSIYFGKGAKFESLGDARTVDAVHISAWLVMAVALLALLLTGGGWFQSAEVRARVEDESTREHRRNALGVGFIATMACAIALYFIALFEPISGIEAVHLLLTVGVAAALLSFANQERRALRDA